MASRTGARLRVPGLCCTVLLRRNQTRKSISKPAQQHSSSVPATRALSYGGGLRCRAVCVALMYLFNPGLPPRRQTHLSTRRSATKGTFRADPGEQTQGELWEAKAVASPAQCSAVFAMGGQAGGSQTINCCSLSRPGRAAGLRGEGLRPGCPEPWWWRGPCKSRPSAALCFLLGTLYWRDAGWWLLPRKNLEANHPHCCP